MHIIQLKNKHNQLMATLVNPDKEFLNGNILFDFMLYEFSKDNPPPQFLNQDKGYKLNAANMRYDFINYLRTEKGFERVNNLWVAQHNVGFDQIEIVKLDHLAPDQTDELEFFNEG